jgi:hypothetical protein
MLETRQLQPLRGFFARLRSPVTLFMAALLLAFGSSQASAVAIIADPFPSPSDAAQIANLVNQYLQAAAGATTTGGWLDAAPSGTAPNRGQSLILPSGVVPIGPNLHGPAGPTPPGNPPPGSVIISFSSTAVFASVFFNDGVGDSGTLNAAATQFLAGYGNTDGSTLSFLTFCIDLTHTVATGQTYSVTPRDDVQTAFVHGAQMAYIIDNFGSTDLSLNPLQAAAVQIALWDLSLNNNANVTSFGLDPDGSYGSGNENVFKVNFSKVPEPASASLLTTAVLLFGAASLLPLLRRLRPSPRI